MMRLLSALCLAAILATGGCGGSEHEIKEPPQEEIEKRKAQHEEQRQQMQKQMQEQTGKRRR